MANAQVVAETRVALSLAIVSDQIKVTDISKKCRVTTDPDDALAGKFTDLGIDDVRIIFFRDILSDTCPEIADEIDDENQFPLAADMQISIVVNTVAALFLNSDKWSGQCSPHEAPVG